MREALRIAVVLAWLAVAWTAAPLARVDSADLVVVVPLVVLGVGAVLAALERRGAGAFGITLTVTAVWLLAVATWGVVGGSVLVVSAAVVLVVARSAALARARLCNARCPRICIFAW